jgi:hypothetical protein
MGEWNGLRDLGCAAAEYVRRAPASVDGGARGERALCARVCVSSMSRKVEWRLKGECRVVAFRDCLVSLASKGFNVRRSRMEASYTFCFLFSGVSSQCTHLSRAARPRLAPHFYHATSQGIGGPVR